GCGGASLGGAPRPAPCAPATAALGASVRLGLAGAANVGPTTTNAATSATQSPSVLSANTARRLCAPRARRAQRTRWVMRVLLRWCCFARLADAMLVSDWSRHGQHTGAQGGTTSGEAPRLGEEAPQHCAAPPGLGT